LAKKKEWRVILFLVAAIVLFSFGHVIGGSICLALFLACIVAAVCCDF
jgi:NhaP-type Na+/H+ and K+/H+ antiporter